jgi:hypothetical protein
VLTSCNDETTFKEDDSLKEKIQSLKSAKSAEDIREVYKYLTTEEEFSEALEVLTDNNLAHLLEHLTLEEFEPVTLCSGLALQTNNDEYYYDDIRLTQEQVEMLSDPNFIVEPIIIDKNNPSGSIRAFMVEKYPNIQFPSFDVIKETVNEYNETVKTRGAGLVSLLQLEFWTNCPYVINSSFSSDEQARIQSAINHWNTQTSVTNTTLVPRTNQSDYIEFVHGSSNSSNIGKKGGRQTITLVQGGFIAGNVIHEIGHAFGLYHEHSKENRDNHITVHSQNIQSGKEHNFTRQIVNCAQFATFDFGSIMLYSSNDFSKNGQPTLTGKDGTSTWTAQRTALSQDDVNIIPYMKEISVYVTFVYFLTHS